MFSACILCLFVFLMDSVSDNKVELKQKVDLPVMSFRVKYKNSSATLTVENGIHKGSRARLLTLCFLND